MANPELLIREGKLEEALSALSAILRDNPSDLRRRATLFEALAFAGEYERAIGSRAPIRRTCVRERV